MGQGVRAPVLGGELDGHALGNLMLVGLTDTLGDFTAALDEAGAAWSRPGPARATEAVVLKAAVGDLEVEGQVAVQNSRGIRRVELVPSDAPASPDAVAAIAAADQVVLAPGSLYTSLLPVLCVPACATRSWPTPACVVQIANLRQQLPRPWASTASITCRRSSTT